MQAVIESHLELILERFVKSVISPDDGLYLSTPSECFPITGLMWDLLAQRVSALNYKLDEDAE